MATENVEELVRETGLFLTDIEEISDVIYNSEQVFLYDTVAISSHENVFYNHEKNLLRHFEKNIYPIIVTDTIAKEMRILEGDNERYLNYLAQFNKLLFIKEENFFDLIQLDYEKNGARAQFLVASEKAFSDIQPLKSAILEIKKSKFSTAEFSVLEEYNSFFNKYKDKNKGEISLLWLSNILGVIAPTVRVNFIGMDNDLYRYVNRCYFSYSYDPNPKKPRDIMISSNDTLVQAIHTMADVIQEEFSMYLNLYRNPDRAVLFFEKIDGLKSHQLKKRKFQNNDVENLILESKIEIVY